MKVIQVCGTSGTGKTTLIKGLLSSGRFIRLYSTVDGEARELWYNGEILVLGRYNRNNCCGVDAWKITGEQFLKVLDTILAVYEPRVVIFEHLMFGLTYRFKHDARACAEKHGYEYVVVVLTASLNTLSERIIGRTGNESVNFDAVMSKARTAIVSTKKVEAEGAKAYILDTERIDRKSLLRAFKEIIYE